MTYDAVLLLQSTCYLYVVCSLSCKILEFRGPASTSPVPSAVGASVALDKVCAAIANMEEPVRERHAHKHTHGSDIPNYCNKGAADRDSYLMMPYHGSWLPHSHF